MIVCIRYRWTCRAWKTWPCRSRRPTSWRRPSSSSARGPQAAGHSPTHINLTLIKIKISQWCGSEFICRILIGSGHLSVQTDFLKNLWSKSHYLCFFVEAFFRFTLIKSVVRSQNYVFSAPAPPLAIIPAPAPGPAIYCTLEVYCNSSTIWNMSLHPCILQTDCCKYLSKRSFRLWHRLQVSNNFGSTGSATLP